VSEVLASAAPTAHSGVAPKYLGKQSEGISAIGEEMTMAAVVRPDGVDLAVDCRHDRDRISLLTDAGVGRTGQQTLPEHVEQAQLELTYETHGHVIGSQRTSL
jgi:hypothetical protein